MKKIIVTRHAALVTLLIERGIVDRETPVITHATADDVRDCDVIGVLPLSLAALAASVTEVPLRLTPELRGKELDIEILRKIAGDAVTYIVTDPIRAAVPGILAALSDAGATASENEKIIQWHMDYERLTPVTAVEDLHHRRAIAEKQRVEDEAASAWRIAEAAEPAPTQRQFDADYRRYLANRD